SFITESAVTDLPEPDSPTSASVLLFCRSNEMRSTASNCRSPWRNATERSRTERRGWFMASMSTKRLARIERVAHRLADEDQQREHEGHGDEAAQPEPRRLDVRLALRQQFAERGRAWRHPEAEEVERGQCHHR